MISNLILTVDRFWLQYSNHRIMRQHGRIASLRFAWRHRHDFC